MNSASTVKNEKVKLQPNIRAITWYSLLVLSILMGVSSIVFFIVATWTGNNRWAGTACIIFMPTFIGFATVSLFPISKENY